MTADDRAQTLALVIPVYQGEGTLPRLVDEIDRLGTLDLGDGHRLEVTEVVLVHDGAIDQSARVISELADRNPVVQPVWLSRNYGQHPATVAGIAATSADWVATIDEDGLHDPGTIIDLARRAFDVGADLVYATPSAAIPHPWYRNLTSAIAKRSFRLLIGAEGARTFTSFRLVDGVVARSLAAYYGQGVYLDVALTWVAGNTAYQPVLYRTEFRAESERSGYNLPKLLSHFRRLVVTTGTRPLRLVSAVGLLATIVGLLTAVVTLGLRVFGDVRAEGWASVMIVVSTFSGLILLALGVIAEYLSLAIGMASGRPPYLTLHRPPLAAGRPRHGE